MMPGQAPTDVRYRVDEFVQDAISLKITPFMLDNYAHEYEELVRARDAHKIEMENLRNNNARLQAHVYVLVYSLVESAVPDVEGGSHIERRWSQIWPS